jgi:hypothetical protein
MDEQKGYFHIEGRSYPSNAKSFYYPILRRFDKYLENPQQQTKVVFALDYIDSSTTQLLLTLISKLKQAETRGNTVEVDWKFMEDDEDIKDMGQSFSESTHLEFNFIEDDTLDH